MTVHLIKLAVGAESVEDLEAWVAARAAEHLAQGGAGWSHHDTRMTPKRGDDLLRGGSLYWVIRGLLLARQAIVQLEAITDGEGREACRLWLAPKVVRVEASPRRPFQGWRYLEPKDAPADLKADAAGVHPRLAAALKDALSW
jgi:hypothetical protein